MATVLAKYGFGQALDRMRLWEHAHIRRGLSRIGEPHVAHLTGAQRLRLALQELGPTFIKLGQVLSTRPDLVPQDIVQELEYLQNRVASFPSQIAREIIETELGRLINELFATFEDEPLASASLSQVHRATFKDGRDVVVKVQRPGIITTIRVDLEIMHTLATLMENHIPEARLANPVGIVREFSEDLKRELNFRAEANNMLRFTKNFRDDPGVHVPRAYPELCTRRVLVMEYIHGISISDRETLLAEGYDLSLIARREAEVLFRSTLEHGFFHADPHPGNIFILPDNVVCLLDFGMMGTLSSRERDTIARMVYNIATLDEKGTARMLMELSHSTGAVNEDQLEIEVSSIMQQFAYQPISEFRLGDILRGELQILRTYRLSFPTNLVWLLKAIATSEDTVRRLVPEFNMMEFATPFTKKLLAHRLNPLRHARDFTSSAMDLLDLFKDLPYQTSEIIDQLREGRFKMEIEHAGLDPMRETLNRVSNRIAVSIVLAALVMGSSLIVFAELPPRVSDIPVIGLVGYIVSVVLGLWLVISILRGR